MGRISSGQLLAGSLSFVVLAVLAIPPSAAAGPVSPGGNIAAFPTYGGVPVACADNTSYAMGSLYSQGETYHFEYGPSGGIITGWQYLAASRGGTVALQILADQPGNHVYSPVAESAVEVLTPSKLNDFRTHIALGPGSYALAIKAVSGGPECISTGFPYDEVVETSPAPAVGSAPTTFGSPQPDARLNLAVWSEADVDRDGFGDDTEDGCTENTQRHDDCVKPDLPLLSSKTKRRKITFFFTSEEPGTFECHLEDKKFTPCASPLKLKKLKPGRHVFTVRAVDANNNTGPQTSYAWNIDRPRHSRH